MSRILKRIAAGVVIAGVAALLLAAGGYAAGARVNTTKSIPVGLFEHVPEAPGHFVGAALDEAVALAGRAQLAGDGLGDGRLFCDEKAHGVSPYQVMTGRITVLICERLIGPK